MNTLFIWVIEYTMFDNDHTDRLIKLLSEREDSIIIIIGYGILDYKTLKAKLNLHPIEPFSINCNVKVVETVEEGVSIAENIYDSIINDTKSDLFAYVVFYGSINVARRPYGVSWMNNWDLFSEYVYFCTYYYNYFGPYLLNDNYKFVPVKQWFDNLSKFSDKTHHFIRPNDPFKSFTGQVVDKDLSFDDWFKNNFMSDPHSLMVVSSANITILSEMRFVIYKGKAITGSYYNEVKAKTSKELKEIRQGDNYLEPFYTNIPVELFYEVLGNTLPEVNKDDSLYRYRHDIETVRWLNEVLYNLDLIGWFNPDLIYTIDVARVWEPESTSIENKIVEIGSISCSAWYDCNYTTIVNAIVETMMDD